jgi:hypothetical protein
MEVLRAVVPDIEVHNSATAYEGESARLRHLS